MTTTDVDPDLLSINTIRGLCIDAVEKANSGHPARPWISPPSPTRSGSDSCVSIRPTRSGPTAIVSFCPKAMPRPCCGPFCISPRSRRSIPTTRCWVSAAVTLGDLETFRQLGSKCPGHPEYRWTSGVETTTGPLGQGVATSVGMAIGGKWLAARYNRADYNLFDFNVYALAGDGCMMEGISSEAASLAAHLGLSNLCWIYDSNRVTIEGHTDITFTEDVAARFVAYGGT